MVFADLFSILLLLTSKVYISQRKKNTYPTSVLGLPKKISALYHGVSSFGRGKLLVIFESCDLKISLKKASGNFESTTTCALLIAIYLPWKFHEVVPNSSQETSKRGGGGGKFLLRLHEESIFVQKTEE